LKQFDGEVKSNSKHATRRLEWFENETNRSPNQKQNHSKTKSCIQPLHRIRLTYNAIKRDVKVKAKDLADPSFQPEARKLREEAARQSKQESF
jgi:hypothetical protein